MQLFSESNGCAAHSAVSTQTRSFLPSTSLPAHVRPHYALPASWQNSLAKCRQKGRELSAPTLPSSYVRAMLYRARKSPLINMFAAFQDDYQTRRVKKSQKTSIMVVRSLSIMPLASSTSRIKLVLSWARQFDPNAHSNSLHLPVAYASKATVPTMHHLARPTSRLMSCTKVKPSIFPVLALIIKMALPSTQFVP